MADANAQHDDPVDDPALDPEDIPEYSPATDSDSVDDTDTSVEDQARALGWVPEDEYTGKPGRWASADQFLEVHSRNNGALRKAVARQADEMAALKKQMQGLDSAHKRIFDLQIKKAKEEHDQQVAFLKAQKKEALRTGEFETAAELDDQLEAVRTQGPDLPEVTPSPKQDTPPQDWRENKVLAAWADKQPWFEKDEELTAFAGGMGQKIRAQNPSMPFDQLLDEVAARTRKAFPHKFAARKSSPVEGATPGATSGAAGKNTYASLPRDAKQMCDEAVADGGITQKAWVDLYYGYDERRKK